MNGEAKIYNCVVYDCRTLEEREAHNAGYQKGREKGIDEMRDVMLPLLVFQDKKVIEEQAE